MRSLFALDLTCLAVMSILLRLEITVRALDLYSKLRSEEVNAWLTELLTLWHLESRFP